MKKPRQRQTDLPKHIADAIREAWPDGVIDAAVDWDEASFWEGRRVLLRGFSERHRLFANRWRKRRPNR